VELAAALKALIDDPERRTRLGTAARETAVSRPSWRRQTDRIVQALKERCGAWKG